MMTKFALIDRKIGKEAAPRGISCDEDGVFLAGDVSLVTRKSGLSGATVYFARPAPEINFLFLSAYGPNIDLSDRIGGLKLVARYMNEGKWSLARIAAVHLRLPDLPDDAARANLLKANRQLAMLDRVHCSCGSSGREGGVAHKRDVSNEPRIPRGQSGGGEWTSEDGSGASAPEPRMIPAQAVPLPMPLPFELPLPPTEITP